MPTLNPVRQNMQCELSEEILLRSVIDVDFRNNFFDDTTQELPDAVLPQDMSFVEVVKDSADIQSCISTCISGFTLICDGNTMDPNCRNTCISGYTIRCDGHTL